MFADIWRIGISDDAVFFVGLEHLFRYEPKTEATSFWKHERSFGPIANFRGKVILQFRGEGLKYYEQGHWNLLPFGDGDAPDLTETFLASMPVVDEQTMLIVSPESTWYQYDGVQFRALPQYDDIPHRGSITHATAINADTLVVTTQLGKVLFVDLSRGTVNVVKVGTGFLPDAVASPTGDTLVVDDLGFHSVHWPARWKKIDSSQGLVGTVYQIARRSGSIYALTSSGAFVSGPGENNFHSAGWTDNEAWHMLALEDDTVLFAESYEIRKISAAGVIETLDPSTTARLFHRSTFHPDTVYVGTEFGLQVLQQKGGRWASVYRNDEWDNLRVTQIIEVGEAELLLGSERGGIRKLQILDRDDWTVEQRILGTADGLEYGDASVGAYIYRLEGDIIASTASGLFKWQDGRFEETDLGGLTALYPRGKTISLAVSNGTWWAYFYRQLFKRNGHWVEEDVSSLNEGAIVSVQAVADQTLVGGLGTLLVFDDRHARQRVNPQSVFLNSAIVFDGNSGNGKPLPLGAISFSSASSRLTLRYALADFNHPQQVRYRTRLLPSEPNFSRWTDISEQSLVTLAPGDYRFQVEARDSLGRVSSVTIPVTVEPQWFESTWVRLLAGALALLVIYFLASAFSRQRSRRLAEERDRLELMVSERTRALESANQQLDKMAHLDGLTQIPNRRRLDTYLEDVWRQCVDRSRVMAVALIDIDHFKQYNDTHGHQAGDRLLVELAKLLSSNLRRAEDLVARYGDEEFLAVLPGADESTALQVIEDMRRTVADSGLEVTISAGVHVNRPDDGTTVSQLVARADEALYEAKNAGRNQVRRK